MLVILFVAIMVVAALWPKVVFPLLIPVGTVALVILVAIWALGALMMVGGGS